MHKYLKSAMDFLESNMTTVMIAVVIAMLAGGFMYWRRREGLANKEDDLAEEDVAEEDLDEEDVDEEDVDEEDVDEE